MTPSDPLAAGISSSRSEPLSGSHHLHVDGGLYRLLGVATSAEDGSAQAVYEHLHPFERAPWTRPLAEFERRFAPISARRAAEALALEPTAMRAAIAEHKARRRGAEAQDAATVQASPAPTLYGVGFMFSPDRSRVALIRKLTPQWQAGRLNGIGGKALPGETLAQAMAREFHEEAGVATEAADWELFARLGAPEFQVHAFRCFSAKIEACRTMTSEEVVVMPVDIGVFLERGISGLAALVCCALDSDDVFVRLDFRAWADQARAEAEALRA